jgi:hypothetical protein
MASKMVGPVTREYMADLDPDGVGPMPFRITFMGRDLDQPWEIACGEVCDTHETLDQLLFWNLIFGGRYISEELRQQINEEWPEVIDDA